MRVLLESSKSTVSDKHVGFVLPCDENGSPQNDGFIAIDFECMKEFFNDVSVVINAFVYGAISGRQNSSILLALY